MSLGRMATLAGSAASYKKRPGTGPGQFGKEGENVIMLPVARRRHYITSFWICQPQKARWPKPAFLI